MTKILCLAAVLALSGTLVSAQTSSPTPAPVTTPAATPTPAAAPSAKPDLTGTWTLNLGKSSYDPVPAPESETIVFSKTGSTCTMATTSDNERGKEVYALPFSTDGAETPTPKGVFADTATLQYLSTKGEWQDAALILTQRIMYQNSPGTLKSAFNLSADGKTLTRTMHISVDQGEFDTTSVYEKQ
ncbi:hypothetical protein P8936_15875 [Edaphobacter paludis]|uniref:Lipocalin-like domain-containing protein n=1 Tax=Edaphobacter paludis TaxID=3035702 RepID=A0AAU7D767_9BACT